MTRAIRFLGLGLALYVLVVERARPPQTIGGEEETLGTIPYGVDLR
jgi:hypothetical protein